MDIHMKGVGARGGLQEVRAVVRATAGGLGAPMDRHTLKVSRVEKNKQKNGDKKSI